MDYYSIGIVFLVAITGIWKSIPTGFLIGLDPLWNAVASMAGSLIGVFILYVLGSRVKQYLIKRKKSKGESRKGARIVQIFDKYGTIGLGLVGTLIVGPPMTMALGLMVVKSERDLWIWTSIGTIIWSCVLTAVGAYSIEFLQQLAIFN